MIRFHVALALLLVAQASQDGLHVIGQGKRGTGDVTSLPILSPESIAPVKQGASTCQLHGAVDDCCEFVSY